MYSSPTIEETLYRACLCPPLVAFRGPRFSIVASGVIFAGLHFLYGIPSPEYMPGGFILAWAFLKSGIILIPFALHVLGNLSELLFHVAYLWFFG